MISSISVTINCSIQVSESTVAFTVTAIQEGGSENGDYFDSVADRSAQSELVSWPYAFGHHADSATPITSLRLPWVACRDSLFETFNGVNRSLDAVTDDGSLFGLDDLFAYIERTDAARLALAATGAPFDGHERFWGVAKTTFAAVATADLVETCYPDATAAQPFSGHSELVSTSKADRLLGGSPHIAYLSTNR